MPNRMKPKISGLFHNCALNCSLPAILSQIETFAGLDVSAIAELQAGADPVYQNYLTLKRIFATSYGIGDATQLSWSALNDFLKAHSFAATEIIFAPVLREALRTFARQSRVHQFDTCTTILPGNGRYSMIAYADVNRYLNHKLNIHGTCYIANTKKGYVDAAEYEPQPKSPPGATQIEVYFKDAHYELREHEHLGKVSKRYTAELRALPKLLAEAQHEVSGSHDAQITNRALAKVFIHTNRKLHQYITHPESSNTEQQRMTSSDEQLIHAEQYVRMHEPFELLPYDEQALHAIILLTILEERNENKQVVQYLMGKMGQAGYRRAAQLAQALFKHWDNLEHQDVKDATNAIGAFTPDSDFYLACMIGLAAGGAALLIAGLFLSGGLGVIAAAVGIFAIVSSAGMFAGRCYIETEVDHNEGLGYERRNPRGIPI